MRVDLYDGRTFWVHGGTRRARVNLMYQLVAHLDEQELEGQQVESD